MDATESDHSMTWEDFFGSTTDLTPTLIGIYDSLLDPNDQTKLQKHANKHTDNTAKDTDKTDLKPQTSALYGSNISDESKNANSKMEQQTSKVSHIKLPVNSVNKNSLYYRRTNVSSINNDGAVNEGKDSSFLYKMQGKVASKEVSTFDTLSPNVKRMLESVDANTVNTLKQKKIIRASMRGPKSNIPLIGATSKISQSGVDILDTVEIYDQPTVRKSEEPNIPIKSKPLTKLPQFRIGSTNPEESKNEVIYDVPKSKTAFESLSLPYIDQSLEMSPSNDREFDPKVKSPDDNTRSDKNKTVKELKADTEVRATENDPADKVPRPLSMSSIASSSSTSSSGAQNKGINSAYLASIESLDDHSDDMTSNKGSNSFVNSTGNIDIDNRDDSVSRDAGESCALSQLERVCAEIVQTENIYVEDLREVVEGYLHVWREQQTFSPEDLAQLFNNIEEIYTFNRSLCDALNTCQLDPISLARQFVENTSGFAIYTSYCTGYPQTMSRLASLMSCEVGARECRVRQAALQHALPLGSYLLKPVQRILKYHLLLQNLVKQCRSPQTEYALHSMTGIARHIDEMKRRHEHAVRVQEIQSLLYGWNGPDLTTYGELCAEGTFRVLGAKAIRHAFLFDKMLLLTKNREDGILAYKCHIMCNNLMLVESIEGAPLSFHAIPWDNPRAQLTLQARSQRHKREWTLLLKRVILENYNAVIPSHARQLVMELGQNKTDDDILAEKSRNLITHTSMRKQLSAPEYLEKRKMDRERRKTSENRMKPKRTSPAQTQCDCDNVSVDKGVDYTCNKCYTDLCSDCEAEAKDKNCNCKETEKCPECDKSLQFIDAGSVENLERRQNGSCKCDFNSSQESFGEHPILTNRAYHSSDNIANYSDKCNTESKNAIKTCLKCAKIKENIVNEPNNRRKSRFFEQDNKKDNMRSKSKDDPQRSKLSKISTWRRKSEPGLENGVNIANLIAKKNDENNKSVDVNDKVEFECRNCGSTKITKKRKGIHTKTATDSEQNSTKDKFNFPDAVEVRMYNTKHVPKKISKLRKNRAKGMIMSSEMTAKFYTDFSTDVSTENILHISESTESLNNVSKEKDEKNSPKEEHKNDMDIDEETYQKLIEKTDSFKKNELEKVKFLNQQKVIKEGAESESDKQSEPEKRHKEEESGEESEKPLEQIISQLLLQNREFQKILKRQQQRSGANRRNQRLLKSHSNPEDPASPKSKDQHKVRPKYGRQTSENLKRSPSRSPRSSPQKEVQHISDEEHIYETLRIEPKEESKVNEESQNVNAHDPTPLNNNSENKIHNTVEPDYVYLAFDKVKQSVKVDDGTYDVPSSIPVKKSVKETDYYVAVSKNSKDNIYDTVQLRNGKENSKTTTGDYLPMNKEQPNPNAPEIWLSRQKEHFTSSRDRKSGSLPRSFQVGDPSIDEKGLVTFKGKTNIPNKTYLNKDGKVLSTDRPFTIASDKSEISYEDISTYMSENDVLKFKSCLNPTDSEHISKSTLDLEEEIDRCYKNNFEREIDEKNKNMLTDSLHNINGSINSSCEVLTAAERQSLDETDQVHPEHKIYKPTTNFSIRNVLNRFKNKPQNKSSNQDLDKEVSSNEQSPETLKTDAKSPTSNDKRPSALNPRSYSRNLLQRFKNIIADEHPENINQKTTSTISAPLAVDEINQTNPIDLQANSSSDANFRISPTELSQQIKTLVKNTNENNVKELKSDKNVQETFHHSFEDIKKPEHNRSFDRSASVTSSTSASSSPTKHKVDKNKLSIYKQGGRLLGARIAQPDYVDPQTLTKSQLKCDLSNVNVLINRNSIRPDSLLSASSFVTSSSEGNQTGNITNKTESETAVDRRNSSSQQFSNVSSDSFYEESFEKIENVTDKDVCRDSAVYSDQEDTDSKTNTQPKSPQRNIPRLEKFKTCSSYKAEISTIYKKTELKPGTDNKTSNLQSSFRQKNAPPIPTKPKIVPLPNKNFLYPKTPIKPTSLQKESSETNQKIINKQTVVSTKRTDSLKSSECSGTSNTESLSRSESINSESASVKSRVTLKYQSYKSVDESVSSNKSNEGIEKFRSSLQGIHTRHFQRLNSEVNSSRSLTDRVNPNDVSENTTKSVLERRIEIESLAKETPLRVTQRTLPKPKQFNKAMPSKTSLQRSSSEEKDRNEATRVLEKPNVVQRVTSENKEKPPIVQDDGNSNGIAETSWVKTIVNKFQ